VIHALYVHIPFCERKCTYCDFTSVGGVQRQREYTAALRDELRDMAMALPGITLDTVFIGGGTPSLLDTALLAGVLDEIRAGFALSPGAEVTMEANPSSTTAAKAERWLQAGVNRVSLGVQSLDPDVLRFLERVHDAPRALRAVEDVRTAGFERINTDLIYAVPGLDDGRWQRTLDGVLELGCDHLSCYELTVEEGTPLASAVAAGAVQTVGAETALRQHWMAVRAAKRAGLRQYEISNFARPGSECRHNLAYWNNAYYLAAGVGAHGHLPPTAARALHITPTMHPHNPQPHPQLHPQPPLDDDVVAIRYWHTDDIAAYVNRAPVHAEATRRDDRLAESILVGLRLTRDGIELQQPELRLEAERLKEAGLLEWDGCRARVTARGQEVMDGVALRLVSARAVQPQHETTTPERGTVKN
jgi:putative oxygen-independent coproporphyrinogen III oxidase